MKENKNTSERPEENIIGTIWYKFFPFWPLFALLSVILLTLSFVYLLFETPTYNVTATIVINDDENKPNSGQAFQTLNAYETRQLVDNEVLVLQSRSLMKKVVNNLHLYAPIYKKESLSAVSAYLSSPIVVEAKEPEKLQVVEKIFFEFDNESNRVKLENRAYPLEEWIRFPFGTIRFIRNPRNVEPEEGTFYFSLLNPTVVAGMLLNNLDVNTVSKLATAINIVFTAEVPERGEDILNALINEYLLSSIESENSLASNTLAFVDERLQDVEQELDSIERRIETFRSTEGAVDLGEQSRIYLQNVAENDRKIADINSQLAVLDQVEQYTNAQGQTTGVVPTTLGIEDPVLAQLLQRLNELELQLARLKTTTGENNPAVESIENEIQKIRPNIRGIVSNQRSRLLASRNNLTATSNRFNAMVRAVPEQERELLEISRQQAVKRDLYAFLLQRREEAALSTASSIADNHVVDWAEARLATKNSKKIIAVLGGIILAFGLGIGYVLFKEEVNSKVLFRSEVEDLTSIQVASEITNKKHSKNSLKQSAADAVLMREFNQLQAALGLYNEGSNKKKFLITSSLLNEGSSFVGNHFALSLAQTGKKVVLVDLDLSNAETSVLHNLSQKRGFSDFIFNQDDIQQLIYRTPFQNLDVIPAGTKTSNSIEMLLDSKVEEMIQLLERNYDYIVLDTPPLELTSDAYALSRHCDSTLLIIRHGVTPKTIIKQLDSSVKLKSFRDLRLVLNGVKPRGFPRRYYGYGYGYGYETIPNKRLTKAS